MKSDMLMHFPVSFECGFPPIHHRKIHKNNKHCAVNEAKREKVYPHRRNSNFITLFENKYVHGEESFNSE